MEIFVLTMRTTMLAVMVFGPVIMVFSGRTRILTDAELARISGGGITECQTNQVEQSGGKGWYCSGLPTYPCNTLCDDCKTQKKDTDCTEKGSYWQCGAGLDIEKLKVCWEYPDLDYDSGFPCTEMGGTTPCKRLRRAQCKWVVPNVGLPYCAPASTTKDVNETCPRNDCKD